MNEVAEISPGRQRAYAPAKNNAGGFDIYSRLRVTTAGVVPELWSEWEWVDWAHDVESARAKLNGQQWTDLAKAIEALIWACPVESKALPYLGHAKQALLNEGRYYVK